MQSKWEQFFDQRLEAVRQQERLRQRGGLPGVPENALDFSANDYLGLRRHPRVITAMRLAGEQFGWGSGASPVLNGHTAAHAALESALSDFFECEDSLLFASGYAANVGTLSCLALDDSLILSDAYNHASLIDGLRLGKSERLIYPHLDLQHLREQLQKQRHAYTRCLIVTETVFSMDGDCVDLPALLNLAAEYECGVVVDEAHATGVFGRRGAGYLEECGLVCGDDQPIVYKLGTLSKAIGGIGGFASGAQKAIQFLVNHARSYLFSTSPPAVAAAAAMAALELLPQLTEERQQLRAHSRWLRQQLMEAGWKVPMGDSPIVPVIIGSEAESVWISRHLREKGFLVPAIRPPTVPPNTCRLRISLSATHTLAELQRLLEALSGVQPRNRF